MPRYQALLVDLNGALTHSQDCICDAFLAAFQAVSRVTPPKEEIIGIFGLSVEIMLTALTDINLDGKEAIADFIEEYRRQYPTHTERARLIDGALETVKYTGGLGRPVCLITSGWRKNAAHISGRMGLDRYIRFMVTRDGVTCFKPNPEPILKGTAACGTAPEGYVHIGESPFDIETGVTAGVFTVVVPSGDWPVDSLAEQSPDCVAKDITELCSIFDELRRRKTV